MRQTSEQNVRQSVIAHECISAHCGFREILLTLLVKRTMEMYASRFWSGVCSCGSFLAFRPQLRSIRHAQPQLTLRSRLFLSGLREKSAWRHGSVALQPFYIILTIHKANFQPVMHFPNLLHARIAAIRRPMVATSGMWLAPCPGTGEAEAMPVPPPISGPLLALSTVHCQCEHTTLDTLRANPGAPQGAIAVSGCLNIVLRVKQKGLVGFIYLLV